MKEVGGVKILNRKHDAMTANTVYVGRPTIWGNPFVIGRDGTREEVIERFRNAVLNQPQMVHYIKQELKGKDLACWCSPLPCHAEVLAKLAN